jgi:hypothetical protein
MAIANRCLAADYHAQEKYDPAREHYAEALRLYGRLGQTGRETKVRHIMRQFGYLS